ncbi:TraB/GumN family protein [Paenibacillus taichungensis]|uniref:TraB/GumN family protein n=1 Tax=Paenibacillus taichungensis TaxID=484184 RepID=UPI002870F03B|nr:TraB/GumN family protein [Paenibacillus taichungensis]MDR9748572.1 TraB/GumN family protein [Paenibacillus taichungensis]
MKIFSAALLSLFLLTSAFSSVHAAEKSISVGLNGEQIQFSNSAPIVEKGVTLVPLRPLLEKLGVQVKWDEKNRTVSGSKEGLSFSLKIGSTNATANGKTVKLDAAPKQIKNVTYVPLRFAAETTGYNVAWNQSLRQVTLTSGQQSEGSQGFLWKVENKGNTVYMLGTIHAVDNTIYPLRHEIEDAFNAADYLGVEIDFTKVVPDELTKLITDVSTYKDGTTLKDHISAPTYNKVTTFLKENGLPENSFDNSKAWYTQQQIGNMMAAKQEFSEAMGIDMYFMGKAIKEKKPVIGLETFESQYDVFNNFSDALQEKLILQDLDPSSLPPALANLSMDDNMKLWKNGDEKALVKIVDTLRWDDEYFKGMQTDRNIAMGEKIKGYLNSDKKETYMIALGASHFAGDSGLVTMLEKQGFKVVKQ